MKRLDLPYTEKECVQFLESQGLTRIKKADFIYFCVQKEYQLRMIFDKMDRNRSGNINFHEFRKGMLELGYKAEKEDMRLLFNVADALEGGDGNLSYCEWRYLVCIAPEEMHSITEMFQSNTMLSLDIGTFSPHAAKHHDVSALVNLGAGFMAGSVSRTLTAPAERVKTDLQLAVGRPPSVMTVCKKVYAQGGIKAFFQGNFANCLKVAPQSGLFFLLVDTFKTTLPTRGQPQYADLHSFLSGALAGMTSQFLIYPLEPIKTVLTVAPPGRYAGIIDCGKQMVNAGGYRSLFAGAAPTIAGCIPYAGVQFLSYDGMKRYYVKSTDHPPNGAVTFGIGLISSTLGMLMSYPLVLVRTRLQVQGTTPDNPVLYAGVSDCFQKVWRGEGFRGLMKGVVPNLAKAAPAAAINLSMYDEAKNFINARLKQAKYID
jgi:solute carrier family 25 phosphate transporter 23/24/25/41